MQPNMPGGLRIEKFGARGPQLSDNNKMAEILSDLLQQAGHRPPKHGTKWTCANCPPGKPPALKVDDDVYFCHRCQVGGNLVTLKRELGIETVRPRRTPEERKLRQCAWVLAALVKEWSKSQRRWLCVQFQNAYDCELRARDSGYELLRQGLDVPVEVIDGAFNAAQEADWYRQWLDSFDRLTPADLIREYVQFRDALESWTSTHPQMETRNAL